MGCPTAGALFPNQVSACNTNLATRPTLVHRNSGPPYQVGRLVTMESFIFMVFHWPAPGTAKRSPVRWSKCEMSSSTCPAVSPSRPRTSMPRATVSLESRNRSQEKRSRLPSSSSSGRRHRRRDASQTAIHSGGSAYRARGLSQSATSPHRVSSDARGESWWSAART